MEKIMHKQMIMFKKLLLFCLLSVQYLLLFIKSAYSKNDIRHLSLFNINLMHYFCAKVQRGNKRVVLRIVLQDRCMHQYEINM